MRVIVTALAVVALVAGGAIGAVLLLGDDDAGATEVTLEPVDSTGDNPFMASVGEDQPDLTPPPRSGGAFAGDTAGLYGGTTDETSCDPARMVSFLAGHPSEAAAWAGVLDVEVAEIETYVGTLTPVVLRSDTAVTNHGFRNGEATAFQAVLQAGTAVLVDRNGVPVVKCGCGNPLLAPAQAAGAHYRGQRWPNFDDAQITVVRQADVDIDIFILVDVVTGDPFGRPPGTDGSQDGPAPDDDVTPTTTAGTSPGTTPTTSANPGATYDGVYQVTAQGCDLTSFTLTVAGSTVSLGGVPGQAEAYEGSVQPDGSFSIADATGGLFGRFDGQSVSGDMQGTGCTGTFQGQRTG